MKHHFNSSLRTGMQEPGTECGTELQSSKSTWISHNGRVKYILSQHCWKHFALHYICI